MIIKYKARGVIEGMTINTPYGWKYFQVGEVVDVRPYGERLILTEKGLVLEDTSSDELE